MDETRANWPLSVWVGEIEDLKGLTLSGISHVRDFHREIMQMNREKKKETTKQTGAGTH